MKDEICVCVCECECEDIENVIVHVSVYVYECMNGVCTPYSVYIMRVCVCVCVCVLIGDYTHTISTPLMKHTQESANKPYISTTF